ncbi:succinylglutamate desuccinylase/aspartoacylase family protein [Pelagibius marinus]|uniref:succinylglutamate desuccinylase/aspartoacylase family protein n=1 Tax=Pelagibius marinus TaxID=2762760 RepID=UPI001872336F|nr:succinylglutamate desuccinylase/aspartoacylase family protein [Pelagibius marinus]
MPVRSERLPLLPASPGSTRHLTVHRFGNQGARPKVYIQAALHADETPGLLVAHHLYSLLEEAERRGDIQGEVVLVPYANPIGLAQFTNGEHMGRYEQGGGGNFNRDWPDLYEPIIEAVKDRLSEDEAGNVAVIRHAMIEYLATQEARSELQSLRLALARMAADADVVLDLHCDDQALMHIYLIPANWPQAAELTADLGCRAVLLAEDSGGGSFDETFSTPWTRLAQRFPDAPIPAACLAATVELRGRADVEDATARADAQGLFHSLQRFGAVAGDPPPPPAALCEATRLDATDTVRSPVAGVIAYNVELGQEVKAGDVIAWVVDPTQPPDSARTAVTTEASGPVLTLRAQRYLRPGMVLAKVVGKEPLPSRQGGYLLED